jgi:3-hydroxybutyryl-CoA dehydrogenase
VFESVELKRSVFQRLDALIGPTARLASNTSSISISSLSGALSEKRRSRFLGMHFFSPVSRMRLVEVIPAIDTDPVFVDKISETLTAIGKTPIRVKDLVGFAVNRLLHALVIESIRLVEEGVCAPADIDAACKLGLRHPIGPFELLDNTANSLSQSVHEILYQAYCERFLPRPLLRQMVEAGYNGRKSGRGWYRYDKDASESDNHTSHRSGRQVGARSGWKWTSGKARRAPISASAFVNSWPITSIRTSVASIRRPSALVPGPRYPLLRN